MSDCVTFDKFLIGGQKLTGSDFRSYASGADNTVIENLYVNNTQLPQLTDFMFKDLKIINLQISRAGMTNVGGNAFRGLENTLQSLNLASNNLRHSGLCLKSLPFY